MKTPDNELAMVLLAVRDVAQAADFYQAAFGWPRRIESPVMVELAMPDGRGLGLYLRESFAGNTGRMPVTGSSGSGTGTELYVRCADLDACIGRLQGAGAGVLADLAVKPWGDEVAYFADPDGNVVAVARPASQGATPQESPVVLEKRRVVYASPADVYRAWTTVAGIKTFFAPDGRIDLREGGAYEMLFMADAPEGSQGSEGCTIISYEQDRRLSFTWSFPPSMPAIRGQFTRVDVVLEPAGEGITDVTVRQTGWQKGVQWARGLAYFDRAWDLVLHRLNHSFRIGPLDWDNPVGLEDGE